MNKKFLSAFFVLTLGISSVALSKNAPQGYLDWGVQKISSAAKFGVQEVVRYNLKASKEKIGKEVRSLLTNYFAAEGDLVVQIDGKLLPVIHKNLSLERIFLKKLLGFSPEEVLPAFAQGLGRKVVDYGCQEIFAALTENSFANLMDSLTNKILDNIFPNQGASKAKGEAEPLKQDPKGKTLTHFEVEALSKKIYEQNINKPSEDFELNVGNVQEYISVLFKAKLDGLIRSITETVVQNASKTASNQVTSLMVWGVGKLTRLPSIFADPVLEATLKKTGVSDKIQAVMDGAGQGIVGNISSIMSAEDNQILMRHESSKSESVKVENDVWELLTEVTTLGKIQAAVSKKASEAVKPVVKEIKETTQALKDTFYPGEFPEEEANGEAFSEDSSYMRDMNLNTPETSSRWFGSLRSWWRN
ncbi:MAG: hypothetical protein ACRCYZ_03615 [Alphaproteobacteria bacterium]